MRLRMFCNRWQHDIRLLKISIQWHKKRIRQLKKMQPEDYEIGIQLHEERIERETARLKEYL